MTRSRSNSHSSAAPEASASDVQIEVKPVTQASSNASPSANTSAPGATNAAYGAEQIQVLEGLEAVRKRPGMYIGGTGINALHHLVYEVVDNSIDEAMAGHASFISVTIQPDGSCQVIDDGRGIPTDPMKHEDPTLNGRPAIEIVLTKLHAGGKFQQEGSAYKVSGGLHGVGVSCVNALSEYLDAEVYRDGKIYAIGFEQGRVTTPLHVVGDIPANSSRKRGTTVTFRPDPTIFPDTTFSFETLANRLRELAYLNPGIVLKFTDERVGPDGKIRTETFRAQNGLLEYVQYLMTGKNPVASPVYLRREDPAQSMVCEVALQYHDGYNETLMAFANNINNVDGGTHAQGFKVALTRTMNAYAKKAGIIKEKDPVPSGEDLREGLVAIVSVKLPSPTFNNQPKERLLNPEIETFVAAAVGESLENWMEEHPAEAKRLCLKGIIAAQAREAARKARELTRRKTALDSGSMPHKLRDCKTKNVDEAELFIVEGDSAGGSATQGRNVETQAILPLKGKILNVEKARIDKILGFEEIRTLIGALRVGLGNELDLSKLRYGKIIIMTDADVDGSHIRTLLLTFFFRQMPELVRKGHIYIAQPPLYQVAKGHGKARRAWYVLNEKTLDDSLTSLGLENATLVARDIENALPGREPSETMRLDGDKLRRAVFLLSRLEELVTISERRGAKFVDLLSTRANDPSGKNRLPTRRISWRGHDVYAWSEEQALDILAQNKLRLADSSPTQTPAPIAAADAGQPSPVASNGTPEPTGNSGAGIGEFVAVIRELHENRELERIFADLAGLGLSINDFALVREESASGEKMPSKFAWVLSGDAPAPDAVEPTESDEESEPSAETGKIKAVQTGRNSRIIEASNLPEILASLHQLGRRGLEIKRFKGLGEMDAEQLWETTMDASRRVLLRVNWDMASNADALFSVLMGEEVEPRRKFIEDHALEVKNLDV